jgi:hypothetical protein
MGETMCRTSSSGVVIWYNTQKTHDHATTRMGERTHPIVSTNCVRQFPAPHDSVPLLPRQQMFECRHAVIVAEDEHPEFW